MHRLVVGAIVALLSLAAAPPAQAYMEAGHFRTVLMTVEEHAQELGLDAGEPALVAFCAQLPDLSDELDAVKVYRHLAFNPGQWSRWATSENYSGTDAARVLSVQQLLHALTGGQSAKVQEMASATLFTLGEQLRQHPAKGRERSLDLCALGFGLHLYGDSFAHAVLPTGSEQPSGLMYETGRGHLVHESFPDFMRCNFLDSQVWNFIPFTNSCNRGGSKRFLAWLNYWQRAPDCIVRSGCAPAAAAPAAMTVATCTGGTPALQEVCKRLSGLGSSSPTDGDKAVAAVLDPLSLPGMPKPDQQLNQQLTGITKIIDAAATINLWSAYPSCDTQMTNASNGQGLLGNPGLLSCGCVWQRYLTAVNANFLKRIDAGEPGLRDPMWDKAKAKDYVNPLPVCRAGS